MNIYVSNSVNIEGFLHDGINVGSNGLRGGFTRPPVQRRPLLPLDVRFLQSFTSGASRLVDSTSP